MIRFANLNDVDKISKIEKEVFPLDFYTDEQIIYELKDNPFSKTLLYFDNDNCVGYLSYMVTFNTSTIIKIGVLKKDQNKGIGKQLLDYMINSFNYGEVESLTLEVRKSNLNAIKFYEKNNFKNVVTKPHYYSNGEDAIYMMRILL